MFVGRHHESDLIKKESWEGHVENRGEKCTCRVLVRKHDRERLLGKYSPEYERN